MLKDGLKGTFKDVSSRAFSIQNDYPRLSLLFKE